MLLGDLILLSIGKYCSLTLVVNEILLLGWPQCSFGNITKVIISLLFQTLIIFSLLQFITYIDNSPPKISTKGWFPYLTGSFFVGIYIYITPNKNLVGEI